MTPYDTIHYIRRFMTGFEADRDLMKNERGLKGTNVRGRHGIEVYVMAEIPSNVLLAGQEAQ